MCGACSTRDSSRKPSVSASFLPGEHHGRRSLRIGVRQVLFRGEVVRFQLSIRIKLFSLVEVVKGLGIAAISEWQYVPRLYLAGP